MMCSPSGSAKICYATGVGTSNITKRGIERVCVCSVCERERGNERGNKGRAGFEHEGTKSERLAKRGRDLREGSDSAPLTADCAREATRRLHADRSDGERGLYSSKGRGVT